MVMLRSAWRPLCLRFWANKVLETCAKLLICAEESEALPFCVFCGVVGEVFAVVWWWEGEVRGSSVILWRRCR